jgi:ubiquinone/menaquinone biosynthesis C-methylase UbiE
MRSMRNCNGVGTRNELEREAWVRQRLEKIPAGSRLLDAGAGEQRFKKFCEHLQYIAQDFGRYDGKGDSTGLQTGAWNQENLDIISDIAAIPEPNNSFDTILCTEVLEHLPEPVTALAEFSRLLRADGQLILTAPFCSLTHFSPFHFYTGFNRYFYETHLPKFGFRIVEMVGNGNFFEYLAQEVHRLGSVARTYVGVEPNILERLATKVVLRLLGRLSGQDRGSMELLNFGYFVRAVKDSKE